HPHGQQLQVNSFGDLDDRHVIPVAAAAVIQRAPDRVEVPAVPPGAAEIAVVEAAVVAVVVEPLLVMAELVEMVLVEHFAVDLANVLAFIDLSIDKRNAVLLAIGLADGDAVSLTLDLAQQVRI